MHNDGLAKRLASSFSMSAGFHASGALLAAVLRQQRNPCVLRVEALLARPEIVVVGGGPPAIRPPMRPAICKAERLREFQV